MSLFQIKHSAKEAFHAIDGFYRIYHSIRYFKGLTILRFTQTIPSKIINRLNSEFKDILAEGEIYASPPLKGEIKDKIHIEVNSISNNAKSKIEKTGGRVNVLNKKN